MLSTEGFSFQKKERSITAVDNEVSESVRLPFYESLLIGQETSVRFSYYCVSVSSGLNLERKQRHYHETKKTVRNRARCPYK